MDVPVDDVEGMEKLQSFGEIELSISVFTGKHDVC